MSGSGPPRVSVVIPCFNLGDYLLEALASVDQQTLRDHEAIIVDDGSTDAATIELLERLSRAGRRVIRAPHGGVCRARNLGLATATGEYLSFLDADDRLHPDCLARASARLDADPTLTFVSFGVRIFGEEEWVWHRQCDERSLLNECCVATPALVRRSAVAAIGGFDPRTELGHEDWDLWLKLVAGGGRGEALPDVLFEYRRRAGSRSALADDHGVYLLLLRERFAKYEALHRTHLSALLDDKDDAALRYLAEASASLVELDRAVAQRRQEVQALRRGSG